MPLRLRRFRPGLAKGRHVVVTYDTLAGQMVQRATSNGALLVVSIAPVHPDLAVAVRPASAGGVQ